MAKKSASGINKSELIRSYVAANPGAKPKAIAAALSTQTGEKFTPTFVSTIKTKLKKDGGKKPGKRGRKPKSAMGTGFDNGVVAGVDRAHGFSAALPIFKAANELLKVAGNRATAREVLDMMAALRS
jgi:hypothetical protein